jgi:hypothetical protein
MHEPVTTWHVVDVRRSSDASTSFIERNTQPRRLQCFLAPYRSTHRLVAAHRRRTSTGLSNVRLILDPLHETDEPLVVHASLMTIPPLVAS